MHGGDGAAVHHAARMQRRQRIRFACRRRCNASGIIEVNLFALLHASCFVAAEVTGAACLTP